MRRWSLALASLALCLPSAAARPARRSSTAARLNDGPRIPPRPRNAPTGSRFMHTIWKTSGPAREAAVLKEVLAGDVPDYWRKLVPVPLKMMRGGKVVHTGVVMVTPDYLSIGSDADFVRMPLTPITAQRIANAFGFLLPTRKLVDEIYKHADVKLTPNPLGSGPDMVTTGYFMLHNQKIQAALKTSPPRGLVAGHKKDVVISNVLDRAPGKVAIYGWHTRSGKAIQPLSTVHANTYADYSHGIRFIYHKMLVDGVERSLESVLHDPKLAALVSDEGPIKHTSVSVGSEPPRHPHHFPRRSHARKVSH